MIQPEVAQAASAAVSDQVWLAFISSLPAIIAAIFVGVGGVLSLWLSWRTKKSSEKNSADIATLKDEMNGHMSKVIERTATASRAEGAKEATAALLVGGGAASEPAAWWCEHADGKGHPPPFCRDGRVGEAPVAPAKPTHRCKTCGALWRLWEPGEAQAVDKGSWSLVGNARPIARPCCDNVPMGEQIEQLDRPAPAAPACVPTSEQKSEAP